MTSSEASADCAAHEAGVISFLLKQRQERYRSFITSKKSRTKFLRQLSHSIEWDDRYIIPVSSSSRPAEVISQLRDLTAPRTCCIISSNQLLDRQMMDLDVAIEAVLGDLSGTVVSCIPARLAYYEGEDRERRFILYKPA